MQNLGTALAKSLTSTLESSPDETSLQPMPVAWVERLFERLGAILGARMADIVVGSDAELVKREWSEALAGYSNDELRRGIATTRTRKFPPNLPEFLHLCRPALDPEVAWLEAEQGMKAHGDGQRHAWSHPAVYWAGRQMQHELRTANYAQCRKRWDRLMAEEWAKGAWASPPDPRIKALTEQSIDETSHPDVRAAAIEKLRQLREHLTMRQAAGEEDGA